MIPQVEDLRCALDKTIAAKDTLTTKQECDDLRADLLPIFADLEKLIDETHARYMQCTVCNRWSPYGEVCDLCSDRARYGYLRVRAS